MTCEEDVTFEGACESFVEAGFKEYTDYSRAQEFPEAKLVSYQKRITDECGTLFFVNVHIYDLSMLSKLSGGKISVTMELDVQFTIRSTFGDEYVNITRTVNGPYDAIEKTQAMWEQLGADYYYEKST